MGLGWKSLDNGGAGGLGAEPPVAGGYGSMGGQPLKKICNFEVKI